MISYTSYVYNLMFNMIHRISIVDRGVFCSRNQLVPGATLMMESLAPPAARAPIPMLKVLALRKPLPQKLRGPLNPLPLPCQQRWPGPPLLLMVPALQKGQQSQSVLQVEGWWIMWHACVFFLMSQLNIYVQQDGADIQTVVLLTYIYMYIHDMPWLSQNGDL